MKNYLVYKKHKTDKTDRQKDKKRKIENRTGIHPNNLLKMLRPSGAGFPLDWHQLRHGLFPPRACPPMMWHFCDNWRLLLIASGSHRLDCSTTHLFLFSPTYSLVFLSSGWHDKMTPGSFYLSLFWCNECICSLHIRCFQNSHPGLLSLISFFLFILFFASLSIRI